MPHAFLAMLVFASSLFVGAWSLINSRQLGTLASIAQGEFALGLNLCAFGTFGEGTAPTVFKAPGYPAFVCAIVAGSGGRLPVQERLSSFPPTSELYGLAVPFAERDLERAARAVYWGQCVLLAASAALLFLWLSQGLRPVFALSAALAFGTQAYNVVLAGLLSYSVLHIFLLILSSLALEVALARPGDRGAGLTLSGMAWGCATLVRPVTLLLPPFVLVLLWLRLRDVRVVMKSWTIFLLGMAVPLAPWTARNYVVSGHLVPVNVQLWAAVYGATAKKVPARPDVRRWKELREEMLAVQSAVAGQQLEKTWEPNDVADNLALEDAYRRKALRNLRRRPGVYLYNCAESLRTLFWDVNSALLEVFQRLQERGQGWNRDWLWPGHVLDLSTPSRAFSLLIRVLTVLAVGGVWAALRQADRFGLVPGLVAMCVGGAHVVTWMDFRYYYVKLPFLYLFASYALDRMTSGSVGPRFQFARPVGWLVAGALAAWTAWLSITVL